MNRVRGKRSRGAYGKTILRGMLKQHGKVYTEIVPDCSKAILQGIVRGHVEPSTLLHSDVWRFDGGFGDIGFDQHFRVSHGVKYARLRMGCDISTALSLSGAMRSAALGEFNGVAKYMFSLCQK